jgi:hypothetical protein
MASTCTVPPGRWLVTRRVGGAGARMRNQHRTEQCACTAHSFVGGPSGIAGYLRAVPASAPGIVDLRDGSWKQIPPHAR